VDVEVDTLASAIIWLTLPSSHTDIMGDLVFGKSFGTLGATPENRDAIRLLGRAARRNYAVGAMPFLHHSGLERWLAPFRGLYLDRLQYLAFGKRQVMERSSNTSLDSSGRKDIFHYLLNAKDPETGEGLPKSELWMEGNTLIVAGSDTSSTTISATLYHLLRNTACLERLVGEVRSSFDKLEDIRTGPKLHACSYLRACIDEAMRMSPAVPGLLPRLVLPGGLDIPALSLHIPAGVDVGTCTYAIHHHKDYVIEPFTYNPSRWLRRPSGRSHQRQRSDSGVAVQQASESDEDYKIKDELRHRDHEQEHDALLSVFAPFSLGNRACLGKPLVYMEISIAIARLVWKYDMRLVDVSPADPRVRADVKDGRRVEGDYHLRDWFLSANEGPVVQFAERK
jgi:cytochrome P450